VVRKRSIRMKELSARSRDLRCGTYESRHAFYPSAGIIVRCSQLFNAMLVANMESYIKDWDFPGNFVRKGFTSKSEVVGLQSFRELVLSSWIATTSCPPTHQPPRGPKQGATTKPDTLTNKHTLDPSIGLIIYRNRSDNRRFVEPQARAF